MGKQRHGGWSANSLLISGRLSLDLTHCRIGTASLGPLVQLEDLWACAWEAGTGLREGAVGWIHVRRRDIRQVEKGNMRARRRVGEE